MPTDSDDFGFIPAEWKEHIARQFTRFCTEMVRVDEVINSMYSERMLSVNQKEDLEEMRKSKKINRLMSEIVPRLSLNDFNKFKSILEKLNMKPLAMCLPGSQVTISASKESFLPDKWKEEIAKQFSSFINHMKNVDEVINDMYSANMLSGDQKEILDEKNHSNKINFLMSEVVPRLYLEDYEKFKSILEKYEPTLARSLPGNCVTTTTDPVAATNNCSIATSIESSISTSMSSTGTSTDSSIGTSFDSSSATSYESSIGTSCDSSAATNSIAFSFKEESVQSVKLAATPIAERENSAEVEKCVRYIIIAGERGCGKTSLLESMTTAKNYVNEKSDKTVALAYKPWPIEGDEQTIPIFKLEGHDCYKKLSQIIRPNEKHNLNIIPHDMMSGEFSSTWDWTTNIISQSPESDLMFILTKSDQYKEEKKTKLQQFTSEMKDHIQDEIDSLEQKINWSDGEKEKKFEKIKAKYKETLMNIENEQYIHEISCKSGEGLNELDKAIREMIENKTFMIQIAVSAKNLYTQIMKMGSHAKHPYLECNKLLDWYKEFYRGSNRSAADLENNFKKDLDTLQHYGLVFWYDVEPVLCKYIFTNIKILVDVLKMFFNHDFESELQHSCLQQATRKYLLNNGMYESDHNDQLKELTNTGIISNQLMKTLSQEKFEFEEDKILFELVQHLKIAIKIDNTDKQSPDLFFPWFIKAKEPSMDFKQEIDQMMNVNNEKLVYHILVVGQNMPSAMFDTLCILMYQHLQSHGIERHAAWKNVLFITANKVDIYFSFDIDGDAIHIYLQANVECNELHSLRNLLKLIGKQIRKLNEEYPGCVTDRKIACIHCSVKAAHSKVPEFWSFSSCLNECKDNMNIMCYSDGMESFPKALKEGLPKDQVKAEECVKSIKKFLKSNLQEQEKIVRNLKKEGLVGYKNRVDTLYTARHLDYFSTIVARSVCCIRRDDDAEGVGTGFIVGWLPAEGGLPRVFILTCYHLEVQNGIEYDNWSVKFDFKDSENTKNQVIAYIEKRVHASNQELDYILLSLEPSPEIKKYIDTFCEISKTMSFSKVMLGHRITDQRPKINDPLVIIGHPDGKPMRYDYGVYCDEKPSDISLRCHNKSIYYQCSILHGSSGSPCHSKSQKLIAMHCGGTTSERIEYGIPLSIVVEDIKQSSTLTIDQFKVMFPFAK